MLTSPCTVREISRSSLFAETDPGSIWTNGTTATGLNIGSSGTGTLTIADGGKVINIASASANIGNSAGSLGTVTVTGAGSTWTNSSAVVVGREGSGTLTIQDGGELNVLAAQ